MKILIGRLIEINYFEEMQHYFVHPKRHWYTFPYQACILLLHYHIATMTQQRLFSFTHGNIMLLIHAAKYRICDIMTAVCDLVTSDVLMRDIATYLAPLLTHQPCS